MVPTSHYSVLYVKYSSRYAGSNFNLFPVAQPEPETEMLLFKVLEHVDVSVKFPLYGFYGKIAENVNFVINFLKLCNTYLRHFFRIR